MSDEAAVRALARHFFDCVESGDVDAFAACYAPDATIWHNTDDLEQTPEENRRTVAAIVERMEDRVYDDRRVQIFPGGFVQQHVLRATRKHDGVRVALPACMVCQVKDGKIARLDEYFDDAALAAFRKSS